MGGRGCAEGAWKAIVIYCVSYGINVYVCMLLVKEMSAVFCVVVGACVLPGNSFAVSSATVLAVYNIPKVLADGSGSPCVAGQECMEPTEPITWNVVPAELQRDHARTDVLPEVTAIFMEYLFKVDPNTTW